MQVRDHALKIMSEIPKSDVKPKDVKPNPIRVKENPDVKPTIPKVTDLVPPKTKPEDRVDEYIDSEVEYLGQTILVRYDKAFQNIQLEYWGKAKYVWYLHARHMPWR